MSKLEEQEAEQSKQRTVKRLDPQLLECISKYLERNGIYQVKVKDLHSHLRSELPQSKVVSNFTILRILREEFKLHYGHLDKANLKYRDPTYSDKRLWTSRLLAWFLSSEYLVISIDESNFRSDSTPHKQWQFNGRFKLTKPGNKVTGKATVVTANAEDLNQAFKLSTQLQSRTRATAEIQGNSIVNEHSGTTQNERHPGVS